MKKFLKYLHGEYLFHHYMRLIKKDPRLSAYGLYDRIYGNHDNFDIDNPKTLIEKFTWMELYTDTSMWTLCADKYRMREYVAQCGLSDYLPKIYGHWDDPNDINFNNLPKQFVLKTNNGCGTVMMVKDKQVLKEKRTRRVLRHWLKRPAGYMGAQLHYFNIKPCVIAEELLEQNEDYMSQFSNSIVDYKVWCFSGKPECILVVYDRSDEGHRLDMYDTRWTRIPNSLKNNKYNGASNEPFPRPECLEKMLEIASTLSMPFPEVRVDFYVIKGRPIIGELTFTSGYGNYTDEFYVFLGSKVDLHKAKPIK